MLSKEEKNNNGIMTFAHLYGKIKSQRAKLHTKLVR